MRVVLSNTMWKYFVIYFVCYVSAQSSNSTGNTANKYDPCNSTPPPKPNLRKPGRRINQIMCYEYIWEMKHRQDLSILTRDCYYATVRPGENLHQEINGYAAKPAQFPHMGAVGWKLINGTYTYNCGASLISRNFAMTAGHCTRAVRSETLTELLPKVVRFGDNTFNKFEMRTHSQAQDVEIKRIVLHPQFSPPSKYYDIALLELNRSITFTSFIQPACLWTQFDTSSLGSTASSTGWGVTEPDSTVLSPDLLVTDLDIINSTECDELLRPYCSKRKWCGVKDHQICAGKLEGGVDSCKGDSGGPLQVEIKIPWDHTDRVYHVIGITSFGMGCAKLNTPALYTRVSSFVDWIERIVWPESDINLY